MALFTQDNDEDRAAEAVALVLSASTDPTFSPSLREIYHEISQHASAADLLDPLNMTTALLESTDPAALDLLALIGECASAREVVIGVQEQVEKLKHNIDEDTMPNARLLILIRMYASALPRVKHRTKQPQETLRPIVTDICSTMAAAASHASTNDGRAIIIAVSDLTRKSDSWASEKPDLAPDSQTATRTLLKDLLDQALTSYTHCLHACLANRTFIKYFPRLSFATKLESGWEQGQDAIRETLESYSLIGFPIKDITKKPSAVHFVLVSHDQCPSSKKLQLLPSFLPIIISSIQGNLMLDETVSFLLKTLHCNANNTISSDISIPLCTVIPSIASAHPSPSLRHQAFRILSMILSSSDAPLRLQILQDLCTNSEFPQMQVAAVGLVKEAIMEAFSGSETPNLFASPRFLQVMGPTVFRPSPKDFFSAKPSLEELRQSSEPPRLVECLSLLYILLLRDKKNKTGIWDKDNLRNLEKELFTPIRTALEDLFDDPDVQREHAHDIMPLVSLKTALERVEGAVAQR